jgi:hypothetical protein
MAAPGVRLQADIMIIERGNITTLIATLIRLNNLQVTIFGLISLTKIKHQNHQPG